MTDAVDYDFDAWYADNVKPKTIKLLGKVWELPADVPALALLRYQRLMRLLAEHRDADPDTELEYPDGVTEDDLKTDNMARGLVGDDLVDAWLAAGIPGSMFAHVVDHLISLYLIDRDVITPPEPDGQEESEAGDGEGKAPTSTTSGPQDSSPES